jgi:hypothetical protein
LAVRAVDPLAGSEWDELARGHRGGSVFHGCAWARVLAGCYGHRPWYLQFSDRATTVALVPLMEIVSPLTGRRGVCLPFADSCAPLWRDTGRCAAVHAWLAEFARQRKWRHLELRGDPTMPPDVGPARQYAGHRLDLTPGVGAIEERFAPAVRRAVRKAQRSGLECVIGRGEELTKEYYRLHVGTRKRHGLPPQPYRFFRLLQRELLDAGRGFTVLVRAAGEAVAGAVFLHDRDHAIYKYGASDPRAWPMRPNHLLMWEAIRFLGASGFSALHFGRTDLTDAGLARFKRSWGAVDEPIDYFRIPGGGAGCPAPGPRARRARGAVLFRVLPAALNRLAGRLIYPHLD